MTNTATILWKRVYLGLSDLANPHVLAIRQQIAIRSYSWPPTGYWGQHPRSDQLGVYIRVEHDHAAVEAWLAELGLTVREVVYELYFARGGSQVEPLPGVYQLNAGDEATPRAVCVQVRGGGEQRSGQVVATSLADADWAFNRINQGALEGFPEAP